MLHAGAAWRRVEAGGRAPDSDNGSDDGMGDAAIDYLRTVMDDGAQDGKAMLTSADLDKCVWGWYSWVHAPPVEGLPPAAHMVPLTLLELLMCWGALMGIMSGINVPVE